MKSTLEILINDQTAQMNTKIDDTLCSSWQIDRKDVEKALKSTQILDELKEWLKEKLDKSISLCLEFVSQDTIDKVVGYNIALTTKNDIEKVLDKIEEMESRYNV